MCQLDSDGALSQPRICGGHPAMITGAGLRESLGAQRLLSKSAIFRANPALGYGFSLAAFGMALALRFLLQDALPPGFPFLTFFPAVIISAFVAGTRAGLLCTALSFAAVWYWFLDSPGSFAITYGGALALGFFAMIAAVDIALIWAASNSVDRLAAQQAQLNTIIETVPLGILVADLPSGKITGANSFVEQMLGRSLLSTSDVSSIGDLLTCDEEQGAPLEQRPSFAERLQRSDEDINCEVQYQRPDGIKAWARLMARPVREERGRVNGAVIALLDTDDEHNNRIALEEAVNVKELLLYEVNHRVKNSLQLVNSFLFLEALKVEGSPAYEAVMSARAKVDMIARVHQLLYETGSHSSVNMKIITEEVVKDLFIAAGRNDVDLIFQFSGDLMLDIRQATPLILVINEIVTNSIKHGLVAEQPKLICSIHQDDAVMALEFVDNGPGMAPKDASSGSGMGSQIIQGLVHQMRGEIDTKNLHPGMATTLTIPTSD